MGCDIVELCWVTSVKALYWLPSLSLWILLIRYDPLWRPDRSVYLHEKQANQVWNWAVRAEILSWYLSYVIDSRAVN